MKQKILQEIKYIGLGAMFGALVATNFFPRQNHVLEQKLRAVVQTGIQEINEHEILHTPASIYDNTWFILSEQSPQFAFTIPQTQDIYLKIYSKNSIFRSPQHTYTTTIVHEKAHIHFESLSQNDQFTFEKIVRERISTLYDNVNDSLASYYSYPFRRIPESKQQYGERFETIFYGSETYALLAEQFAGKQISSGNTKKFFPSELKKFYRGFLNEKFLE